MGPENTGRAPTPSLLAVLVDASWQLQRPRRFLPISQTGSQPGEPRVDGVVRYAGLCEVHVVHGAFLGRGARIVARGRRQVLPPERVLELRNERVLVDAVDGFHVQPLGLLRAEERGGLEGFALRPVRQQDVHVLQGYPTGRLQALIAYFPKLIFVAHSQTWIAWKFVDAAVRGACVER